jgi:hypothetical protein
LGTSRNCRVIDKAGACPRHCSRRKQRDRSSVRGSSLLSNHLHIQVEVPERSKELPGAEELLRRLEGLSGTAMTAAAARRRMEMFRPAGDVAGERAFWERPGKDPAGWAVQGWLPVVDTGRMDPSGGLMPVRPLRWAVLSGRGSRCRIEVGGTSGEARLCSTDQGPSVHQRLASDCTHLAPEQYQASAIGSQWSRLSLGSNASIR